MNKITFDEYKSAIRTQYEKKKIEDVTGILMNPSPAQLRNLCLILFDESLSSTDEKIMKLFFNVKEEESLRKAIEKSEISRFRPIQSFLRGEKDSENMTRIELAAIFVDYSSRPYKRYARIGGTADIINIGIHPTEAPNVIVGGTCDLKDEVIAVDNKTMRKKIIIPLAFVSLFFMGYTAKNIIFPAKECMQWNENHYEAVDCSNDKLGLGQLSLVVPADEQIMKLEKLDPMKALVFFKNEKPIVWYCKKDGEIELFNQPGFHPETAKSLKPITNYIIQRYKLKCKE
jgi:hypothetical protein